MGFEVLGHFHLGWETLPVRDLQVQGSVFKTLLLTADDFIFSKPS
jgi:hypothetical protein